MNNNGIGEYGTFGELMNYYHRIPQKKLQRQFISKFEGQQTSGEILWRSDGYFFQIFLPGKTQVVTDATKTTATKEPSIEDAPFQEQKFRAYAWPIEKGNSTYVVSQNGDIFISAKDVYYGIKNKPQYNSAVSQETLDNTKFSGKIRHGYLAIDGNTWW